MVEKKQGAIVHHAPPLCPWGHGPGVTHNHPPTSITQETRGRFAFLGLAGNAEDKGPGLHTKNSRESEGLHLVVWSRWKLSWLWRNEVLKCGVDPGDKGLGSPITTPNLNNSKNKGGGLKTKDSRESEGLHFWLSGRTVSLRGCGEQGV